jgi:hypothetical protein
MDTETEVSTTKEMKFTRNFQEKKSTKLSREEKLRFSNDDFLHNYWTSFVGQRRPRRLVITNPTPRECTSNNILIIIIIIYRAIISYNIISRAIIS